MSCPSCPTSEGKTSGSRQPIGAILSCRKRQMGQSATWATYSLKLHNHWIHQQYLKKKRKKIPPIPLPSTHWPTRMGKKVAVQWLKWSYLFWLTVTSIWILHWCIKLIKQKNHWMHTVHNALQDLVVFIRMQENPEGPFV